MNHHLKCPGCGETVVVTVAVTAGSKLSTYGAKHHEALARSLQKDVAEFVAANEGRYTITGTCGLWERRTELPEWLRVIGRDALRDATHKAINDGKIERRVVDGLPLLFRGADEPAYIPASVHE